MRFPKGTCADCGKESQVEGYDYLTKWEGSSDTGYDIEIYKLYYECKCGNKFDYKLSKRVDK